MAGQTAAGFRQSQRLFRRGKYLRHATGTAVEPAQDNVAEGPDAKHNSYYLNDQLHTRTPTLR
jgi:hypothetical protein